MHSLFITHQAKQCGVKAHGNRFVEAMKEHSPAGDEWIVSEVGSMDDIRQAISYWKPDISIVNFHKDTLKYLEPEKNFSLNTKLVALPHEDLTGDGAVYFKNRYPMFEAVLWQDPTSFVTQMEQYGIHYVGRCIPKFYRTKFPDRRDIPDEDTVIKMFGFGCVGKKPEEMMKVIGESFENATVICHFPSNDLTDISGLSGEMMIEKLRCSVQHKGIQVLRTKEMYCNQYMSENDLVQWLNNSDINICFHEDGTGISSTTDLMMAAGVPFAVNHSPFFRHLPNEIKLDQNNTMKDILNKGIEPWRELAQVLWCPKMFAYQVNNALRKIAQKV